MSEYNTERAPSGIPAGVDPFTNHEKLQLRNLTGQEADPDAPIDRMHFIGGGTGGADPKLR
jgi:hypothetical protein